MRIIYFKKRGIAALQAFTVMIIVLLSVSVSAQQKFETLSVHGSDFHIYWNPDIKQKEKPVIRQWLQKAGETLALLNGEMPKSIIRIELQVRRNGKAVPFAQVIRRRPEGVVFLIDPSRPLQEFIDDWTAVHEFTHLFIPYPGEKDIWLSEGLATYYQYLLQARAGIKTEQQAWQKMLEGFERGRKNDEYNYLSLQELSENMKGYGSFMRVYWSGTLFFLKADIALRERSNGKQSLDSVLKAFVQCCRPQRTYWRGQSLISALDEASETTIFADLYKRFQVAKALPDYRPDFSKLGIDVEGDKVNLDKSDLPSVQMRQSISLGLQNLKE